MPGVRLAAGVEHSAAGQCTLPSRRLEGASLLDESSALVHSFLKPVVTAKEISLNDFTKHPGRRFVNIFLRK